MANWIHGKSVSDSADSSILEPNKINLKSHQLEEFLDGGFSFYNEHNPGHFYHFRSFYAWWVNMAWVLINVSDGIALGICTLYGAVLMSNKRLT